MANHLHQQIRAAVVAALTGLATTASRVYANRLMPLPDALSPTLLITLDEETATPLTIHQNPVYERELTLSVTAVVKATGALDAVAGSAPVLMVQTASVPAVAIGTAVVLDSTNYTVVGIQPDGTGITRLVLEAA